MGLLRSIPDGGGPGAATRRFSVMGAIAGAVGRGPPYSSTGPTTVGVRGTPLPSRGTIPPANCIPRSLARLVASCCICASLRASLGVRIIVREGLATVSPPAPPPWNVVGPAAGSPPLGSAGPGAIRGSGTTDELAGTSNGDWTEDGPL